MFMELYKFSSLVMHLNSCSMDLGRDSVETYRIIQTNSLGKYFAELINNTKARNLYPKCFLEFIKP